MECDWRCNAGASESFLKSNGKVKNGGWKCDAGLVKGKFRSDGG